jgi:integrase
MRGKPRKCKVRGVVRWYVDAADPLTGKRKRTFFDSQADADAHQSVVNQQRPSPRTLHPLLDPNVQLDAFAADWLWSQAAAGVWRESTRRTHGDHLATRILPFRIHGLELGAVRVRDINRGHIEAFVVGQRHAGFAPNTVRTMYRLLVTVIDRAVNRGLLDHHPVTSELRRELRAFMKPAQGTPRAFTREQASRFLTFAKEHSSRYDMYVVGFATGVRISELRGLKLDDYRDGKLLVERSLSRVGSMKAPIVGPTKSGKLRHVDVGRDIAEVLVHIKSGRPALALRHGWRPVPPWTFVTSGGHPHDASTLTKDFRRVLKLAGMADTDLTPHGMRHSFASWHIARGCNVKWLQQQLGHATIGITLDTYGDWFKLSDATAADDLAATLVGNRIGNRSH